MTNKEKLIKLVQNRIANISVGASAVRGQPSGTVKIVIDFFKEIDLRIFDSISSESEFLNKLDALTMTLKERIPSKSWGMARKVLNIFLFQSVHDVFLNKKYNLDKIIPFLEVPLDNPSAEKLRYLAKSKGIILKWHNIKNLTKDLSDNLQNFAKHVSKEEPYNC